LKFSLGRNPWTPVKKGKGQGKGMEGKGREGRRWDWGGKRKGEE